MSYQNQNDEFLDISTEAEQIESEQRRRFFLGLVSVAFAAFIAFSLLISKNGFESFRAPMMTLTTYSALSDTKKVSKNEKTQAGHVHSNA